MVQELKTKIKGKHKFSHKFVYSFLKNLRYYLHGKSHRKQKKALNRFIRLAPNPETVNFPKMEYIKPPNIDFDMWGCIYIKADRMNV